MPVRYQRFTYRYLQGRPRPADTAFEHVWLAGVQPSPVTATRRPPVDVWETPTAFVVKVMLAGVSEEEIKALLYEDVLVVSATRTDDAGGEERRFHRAEVHYGQLEVTVPLPAPVDPDGIDAVYRQGVLTIRLAKYEAAPGPGASA
jgi:HSP20 family molecular chaperone IbpA